MKPIIPNEKQIITSILSQSFQNNKSVNFIVKQDSKKNQRITHLMGYSYDVCKEFGEIFINDKQNSCALVLYPEQKKTTLQSILCDINLVWKCIGLTGISKSIKRESEIKKNHPNKPFTYLWFIGVTENEQGKGLGTKMLQEILKKSKSEGRDVYLETSTERNLPLYKRLGFKIYNKLNFGYDLYLLKVTF